MKESTMMNKIYDSFEVLSYDGTISKTYKTFGRAYNSCSKLIKKGINCQLNGKNESGVRGLYYC